MRRRSRELGGRPAGGHGAEWGAAVLAWTRPVDALRAPGMRRGSAGGMGGTDEGRDLTPPPLSLSYFEGCGVTRPPGAAPWPTRPLGEGGVGPWGAPGLARAVTPALAARRRRERRVSHGGGREGRRERRGRALPPPLLRAPPLSLRLREDPQLSPQRVLSLSRDERSALGTLGDLVLQPDASAAPPARRASGELRRPRCRGSRVIARQGNFGSWQAARGSPVVSTGFRMERTVRYHFDDEFPETWSGLSLDC